jgi:hypothetical protein
MSWPANPNDGQQVTINGVLYQYDATPGVWNRVGAGASSVAVDSFTAANLTITNHAHLGDISNVTISGGTNGYSLTTDGAGNLSWSALGDAVKPAGTNTQIQYNNNNNFAGSNSFTFDAASNTLSVTNISANGAGLTNISGPNVIGIVPNANYAAYANFATSATNATNAVNATSANTSLTAGTVTANAQPNITSIGTLSNLTVTSNVTAGNIIARTYGAHQGPVGNITPNTGAFTSISASGNAVISGNVSSGNINSSGIVSANLLSGALTTNAQPNITSVGTLSGLSINGEITGHLIPTENEAFDLGSPTKRWRTLFVSANTINLGDATISSNGNNITTSGTFGSDNITISGQYTSTLPTGNAPFVVFSNTVVANLNASLLNGLTATPSNVANTIVSRDNNRNFSANIIQARLFGQANTASTVITNAQPNITSVGTLTGLTVNGNLSSGNATLGNLVTANFFSGNGSLLTGVNASALVGSLPATVLGNTTTHVGTTAIALNRSSNPQTLTGVNIDGSANTATTAGTVTTNAQPNITSVGSLTGLTVNGNLIVTGSTQYANVTTLNIKDPIIEMGGNPNGAPLSGDDGKDRGTLLHYFNNEPKAAFMGWDNSNVEFVFGENVSVTTDVVTVTQLGNIRAQTFIGNIVGNSVFAETSNTVVRNVQPNITSVGTLTGLTISSGTLSNSAPISITQTWNNASVAFKGIQENIIDSASAAGSSLIDLQVGGASRFVVDKAGLVTANSYAGDGGALSNIAAANLVGAIELANRANFTNSAATVSNAEQPNITSLGTLTSLDVNTGELVLSNPVTINQTWNTSGLLFTALETNVVDSNSAPDSLLADMRVDGVSKFSVEKTGNVRAVNFIGNLVGNFSGNVAAPGSNRQVMYNDNGSLNGSNNFTFNEDTNALTVRLANFSTGPVTASTPINFTQSWNNAQINFTGIRQNITDLFSNTDSLLIDLQVSGTSRFKVDKSGNVTGTRFIGSGIGLTNIPAANLVGSVPVANFANFSEQANIANIAVEVSNSHQPNITSVGELTSLRVSTGVITSNVPYTFLQSWNNSSEQFTSIRLNVTDTDSLSDSKLVALELDGASQFEVSKTGNVFANGVIEATSLMGEGGNISNIQASNIVGIVSNSVYASSTLYADSAGNANIARTVSTNAQPNITSVGTLTGLNISSGTLTSSNPLSITQGWQNGAVNFTGIGLYVTDTASNTNSNLLDLQVGGVSRVRVNKQGHLTATGNISGNFILGDGGLLSNIPTGQLANFANFAGNVTVGAQPNITSVGNLSGLTINGVLTANGNVATSGNLSVTGNITAADANLGNSVVANFFSGDANFLSNIPAANIVGAVPFATLSNTVSNGAQPNITSVGTLTNVVNSGDYIVQQTILNNSNRVAFSSAATTGGNPTITLGSPSSLTIGQYALASKLKIGDQLVISGAINDSTSLNRTYTISGVTLTPSSQVSLIVSPDIITRAGASANVSTIAVQGLRTIVDTTPSGITGYFDVANIGTLNTANLVATAVSNNAQPNITSLGNLSNLISNGVVNFVGASNVSLGNVGNVKILGGSNGHILSTNGSGAVSWIPQPQGGGLAIAYDNFVGTGSTTTFTLGVTPISKEYVNVNIDGISQLQSSFLVSGNSISFGLPPSLGENIQVQVMRPAAGATGGLVAPGSNTQLIFNNSGDFGASSGLVYNQGTETLTVGNISTTGANLGNVSNVRILGGSANYVLKTDGAGNLSWSLSGATIQPGGNNTEIQFNDGGNFAGSSNLSFNKTTGTLSANNFAGNASGMFSIPAANITGSIEANTANLANTANVAVTVSNGAQPNITSVGTLTTLNVTGNIVGGNFVGNLSGIANSATTSNTVSVAAQPNITSVGTLTSANINGLVNVTGIGGLFTSGGVSNPTGNGVGLGTVGNNPIIVLASQQANANNKIWDTYVDGTGIYYGRVVNDTGTTSNNWLRVTRDSMTVNTISLLSNTTVTGTLSANSFAGDGSNITNVVSSNITIATSSSNTPHYFLLGNATSGSQNVKYASSFFINPSNNHVSLGGNASISNNLSVGGNVTVANNLTLSGNISALNLSGNGAGITGLSVTNVNTSLADNNASHFLFVGQQSGGVQPVQYAANVFINPSLNTMNVGGTLNSNNLTVSNNLTLSRGFTMSGGATESFVTVGGTSSPVTFNLIASGVFNTTLSQNSTAAFTNISTADNFITGITTFVTQGSTGYGFANATVNGGSVLTIRWAGGSIPTPSTNSTDVFTFSIARVGGVYTVYGQSVKFG